MSTSAPRQTRVPWQLHCNQSCIFCLGVFNHMVSCKVASSIYQDLTAGCERGVAAPSRRTVLRHRHAAPRVAAGPDEGGEGAGAAAQVLEERGAHSRGAGFAPQCRRVFSPHSRHRSKVRFDGQCLPRHMMPLHSRYEDSKCLSMM